MGSEAAGAGLREKASAVPTAEEVAAMSLLDKFSFVMRLFFPAKARRAASWAPLLRL